MNALSLPSAGFKPDVKSYISHLRVNLVPGRGNPVFQSFLVPFQVGLKLQPHIYFWIWPALIS